MDFGIIAQMNAWLQLQYTVAGAIGPSPERWKRLWVSLWLGPPGVRASPPDRSRPAAGALWTSFLMSRLAYTVPLAQGNDHPDDKLPAFDFASDFSLTNGINPAVLLDRLVAQDAWAVVEISPHEDCTDITILEIKGISSNCPSDPADAQAMAWVNAGRALIFPKASGDPLSPAPPQRRQDNVFDTRNDSFSHTPLTAYTHTGRRRASSGFCGPRFQGWNITTQGGPQQ